MKRSIQLILSVAIVLTISVQCKVSSPMLTQTTDVPITEPAYPGGELALQEFAKSNLMYPETAKENCIEGEVNVLIGVLETGDIANAIIIDGIGFGCDDECLRLISMMPRWEPAILDGRAISSNVLIPIRFRMQ